MMTIRSGKTSIDRVIFQKMSPHETLFLESTNYVDINNYLNNRLVQFQTWDFGGDLNLSSDVFYMGHSIPLETIFKRSNTLVYVIDAQEDDYEDSLPKLAETISVAHSANPNINFEVFLHKVDGDFMSEETKAERKQVYHTLLYIYDVYVYFYGYMCIYMCVCMCGYRVFAVMCHLI